MSEPSAGKEISVSKLKGQFFLLQKELEASYPICCHLIKIRGKRWEYIIGKTPPQNIVLDSYRLKLNPSLGVIIYGWHDLRQDQREQVSDYLKKKLLSS